MIRRKRRVARALAWAFLAGVWNERALLSRGEKALGQPRAALRPLAKLVLRLFRTQPSGREVRVTALLYRSRALSRLIDEHTNAFFDELEAAPLEQRSALEHEKKRAVDVERWIAPPLTMAEPLQPLRGVDLPHLVSASDIASLTGLPDDRLEWFADLRRMNRSARDQKLRHYRYRWIQKRSGAYRLLEIPKPTLKVAQRHIVDRLLAQFPMHPACHGHRRGRSVKTFVAAHAGKQIVVAFDLAEFFSVVSEARVRAIFAAFGYSDVVATILAALTCTPTPADVLSSCPLPAFATTRDVQQRFFQKQRLRTSHLAQGAPSSPALANLAAYKLNLRLSALASTLDASYGRYADDLAFSGGERLERSLPKLVALVGAIARDEGFELRFQKTRVMRASQRQHLCGVVVNDTPSMARRELERLEATLFNCVRLGAESQNRAAVPDFRAHLAGRVEWARHLHPGKGERLRVLFERIAWSDAAV